MEASIILFPRPKPQDIPPRPQKIVFFLAKMEKTDERRGSDSYAIDEENIGVESGSF